MRLTVAPQGSRLWFDPEVYFVRAKEDELTPAAGLKFCNIKKSITKKKVSTHQIKTHLSFRQIRC